MAAGLAMAGLAAGPAAASNGRPRILNGPDVTGTAQVGQRLTAAAAYTGHEPIAVQWSWLRCSGDDIRTCRPIPGAASTSYVLQAADAGQRVRAMVRLDDDKGWAWQISPATGVVAARPPVVTPPVVTPPVVTPPVATPPVVAPPVVIPPEVTPVPRPATTHEPRFMRPAPTVRIRGWLTRSGARVTGLIVRAPRGARVTVRCWGASCPRRRMATTAVLLHLRRFEVRLHAGTRLVVTITKPGFIGKHTVIVVRRGKAPRRRDRCLLPGRSTPRRCPS